MTRHVSTVRALALACLLVLGGTLGACSASTPEATAQPAGGGAPGGAAPGGGPPGGGPGRGPAGPTAVRTTTVELGAVEQIYRVTGEFVARDTVPVAPLSSGLLQSLAVDEGMRVEAGQLLGQLDDTVERQAVTRADAARRTASARVELVEAQRREHEAEIERRRALRESGAMAAADFASLEARLVTYDAELGLARAQLGESEAALRAARVEVERRELRAPVAGLVVERLLTAGAWVTPQAPVLRVVDEASIELVLPVPERDIPRLRPGMALRVLVDGFEAPLEATIVRMAPQSDPQSRTVAVAARVAGETSPRPGTFGAAELVLERVESTVVVPVEALTRNAEQVEGVYVVAEGTARFAPVTVALRNERQAAVTGVDVGSAVVLGPPRGLVDGGAVVVAGELPERGGAGR